MRRLALSLMVITALIAGGPPTPAAAQEVKEIAVAQQFGAIFIPLMAMENLQLIEKQATARGIGDVKVNWAKLAGPSVMVDAILSGNLHFSAQGVPSLALMWDRTKGGVGVRAVSAITNTDIYLHAQSKHQVDPGFHREGPHRRAVGEGIDAGAVPADRGREGMGARPAHQARLHDRGACAS
jgi:ABC-type nitrate/sulfonate/bicarbonate transport system substrate-binding protein